MPLDATGFGQAARQAAKPREIDLPMLGGTVFVRLMRGDELEEIESTLDREGVSDAEAFRFAREWIYRLTVNESGDPLFSGADDPNLKGMAFKTLLDVFPLILEGSAGTSVEGAKGKSRETPASDGGSN